jgi:AcrR family transcriptional regulator
MILIATPTLFHQEGVDVSNRSLFNYFPTKQVLIDALYAWSAMPLGGAQAQIDGIAALQTTIALLNGALAELSGEGGQDSKERCTRRPKLVWIREHSAAVTATREP